MTEKNLRFIHFLIKLQGLRTAALLKRNCNTDNFLREISKNTYFVEELWTTVSECSELITNLSSTTQPTSVKTSDSQSKNK